MCGATTAACADVVEGNGDPAARSEPTVVHRHSDVGLDSLLAWVEHCNDQINETGRVQILDQLDIVSLAPG